MENTIESPDASGQLGPTVTDHRDLIAHHMAALEDLIDPHGRSDGWTPTARKGFLRLVAEHGRVSDACHCIGLSKQSAYSLRARDPIFAIGWDAACQMARMPLADQLYERAVNGLTDTITHDDGRTVTRHRLDSRLSIAVLNRLDRRCDKAAETGSHTLGAIAHWDEFVAAIGDDDAAAAQAIIDAHHATLEAGFANTVNVSQPSQLSGTDDDPDEDVLPDPRIWWESGRSAYRTNFAPPDGSDCHEHEQFGHRNYHRSLTDAETVAMADRDAARDAKRRSDDGAERDAFFAGVGEADLSCPAPLGDADVKAPSAPSRGGNVGEGEMLAPADGRARAAPAPPLLSAPSPKGKGQQDPPPPT